MCYAAGNGHIDCVERLIKAGADVNTLPSTGERETALMKAAKCGHVPCVELLLQAGAGATVNTRGCDGFTALIFAAYYGHWGCIKTLLNAGADVKLCLDTTALMESCDVRSVELLLRAGADVNKQDRQGRTALMFAAMDGHWECVKTLLDGGANEDMTNDSCETMVYFVLRTRRCTSNHCSLAHHDRVKCMKLSLSARTEVNHVKLDFSHVDFKTEKERQGFLGLLLAVGDKMRLAEQDDSSLWDDEICRVRWKIGFNSKKCLMTRRRQKSSAEAGRT